MGHYLNRTAYSALRDVDVIVFVVQALAWTSEDERVLRAIGEAAVPTIAVVNKVDLVEPKEQLLPFLQDLSDRHHFEDIVPVSALRRDNTQTLIQTVLHRLPEGEAIFPDDQVTDRSQRFFAAELLREQITRRYHRELPYAVTVEIERFEEADGRCRIAAVIWVEREGQRAILLGKDGKAMKETATAARKAMNQFFQTRVHLDVWVKVKKSWSSDEASLVKLGYSD
jgi:GTP-binding protein Era